MKCINNDVLRYQCNKPMYVHHNVPAMSVEKKEKKILVAFTRLHKLGRVLGLSCYTLPTDGENPMIKVTTLDVVLFIFMFSTNVYLTYYNYQFWEAVSTEHKRDTLFSTGIKIITTGSLILTLIGAGVVFFMRERLWRIIVDLQDIADKVEIGNY